VALALGQHDLKRLLAYHSIENIGIILLGLGLGTLGKSTGHPVLQVLGFAGALLHVLNHSLFKGLLFLAAGSVVHAVGTRDLERMGGLGQRMPWTSAAFLAGSWAISGLPPLNGFVSEWFIYLGSFRALGYFRWPWSLVILTALALIGALAMACFAKAYGAVFQGSPRTEAAGAAHESPRSMLLPMGILAGACALIGLAPMLLAPALDRVVAAMSEGAGLQPLSLLVHLPSLTILALTLLGSALLIWRWLRPLDPRGTQPTWDCGYAASNPRMQYTASSFADGLVGGLGWVLWPKSHGGKVAGCFPVDRPFESHVPDLVLDRLANPAFRTLSTGATLLRFFQGGKVHIYLLYVLLTLLTLLLWMVA
jgi:hydrogenase-4 component B